MTLWKAVILTGMFFSACTIANKQKGSFTYLKYTPAFQLKIHSNLLSKAVIFNSDGLAIKFNDKKNLSGFIINKDNEHFPNDFNLQLYPQYLLGIKSTKDLTPKIEEKFNNSIKEVNYSFPKSKLLISKLSNNKIYSLCNILKCISFLVKKANHNEILMLNTNGFTKQEIDNMLTGV